MKRALGASMRARGQALIAALLLVLLLAAGTLLAGGELRTRTSALAHARSVAALAQARDALIGYAISYDERHPGEGYGFLPCPDSGNSGSTPIGACGARELSAIGRLPWRTLGLADLRDGWGECLWYAVAGSIKHNPKPLLLNWDNAGQFALQAGDGRTLAAAAPDHLAVAVVFAPGPPLPGQVRPSAADRACSGSASAAADLSSYLEGAYPSPISGALTVAAGEQPAVADGRRNDLIAWIGIDDIFDALRRRADHADHVDALITTAADALAGRLGDADFIAAHSQATPGALRIGLLPTGAALALPAADRLRLERWRDQFRFAVCTDGSACIDAELDPPSTTQACRGVLLFAGERIRSGAGAQPRLTAAQRADPAQYFEGNNARHLSQGIPSFTGAARFRVADPHQPATADVLRCLP